MKKRIVFMGSPDFAVPSLRLLAENFEVVGVVTQPDRRAGRGRGMKPPAVKVSAEELGFAVIQPERLKNEEAFTQLQEWAPDLIVVAAYGQILRKNVLELPLYGCINVHASLLPRWRGASPIQAAIAHGDEQTGVTIMQMDVGLDTGPMLSQKKFDISDDMTAGELEPPLAQMGAELLIETLPGYFDGSIQPVQQPAEGSTYAPLLKKADGRLDPQLPAVGLERMIRANNPWPGCFLEMENGNMKVHKAHVLLDPETVPGTRMIHDGLPALATVKGVLVMDIVQPPGKKAMPGNMFLHGARNWETN